MRRFLHPQRIAFTGYKWVDAFDPASGEIPKQQGAETPLQDPEPARYAAPRNVTSS
jgi:hypothetical protein